MIKRFILVLFLVFSFVAAYKFCAAELLERGQSSEQVLEYRGGEETPQPYGGGIEEYPEGAIRYPRPDYPYGTLKEDPMTEGAGPDTTLRQNATNDSDVTEAPMQEGAGPDTTLREKPMTEGAGPDTTLRQKATNDSDVQESADPYGPTPDLFEPPKERRYN